MIQLDALIHQVADAFRNCGRPVGEGDVPEETPEKPYIVLDMLPSGLPEGGWRDENDMRDYFFQVQCVGEDQRQVSWMQSHALKAWSEYGLLIPGCVGRWLDTFGAIVRVDDRTYNATDTYRMKVQG